MHAAKFFPPPFGGIETVLDRLVHGLADLDPSLGIEILASRQGPPRVFEPVPGRIQVREVRSWIQVARTPIAPSYPAQVRKCTADLLHFHFPYPWAELSFLLAGPRIPYVVSYHSDIVKQKKLLKLWGPFMRKFLAGASRIVVASPNILKSSPVLQGDIQAKTQVIPYGIDTEAWSPTEASKAEALLLRESLAGSKPLLFFLGRLVYYKGAGVLIEAMKDCDAHLVLGGAGPMKDELVAAARAAGVESKVTFAGEIPPERLPLYYQASDLFILPSTDPSEAFGMVMLEAHASGIPVVSSDLPTGVTFVNQHGETGLCAATGDPKALAASIRSLLEDPERRQRMGLAAQSRVRREFSTPIMAGRYRQLYQDVLEEARSQPRRASRV